MKLAEGDLEQIGLSDCICNMDPSVRDRLRATTYTVARELLTGVWTWENLTEEVHLIRVHFAKYRVTPV